MGDNEWISCHLTDAEVLLNQLSYYNTTRIK